MTRYLVVAGLFVLSLITYVDRAAISSAKDPIGRDLALDDQAMGAVFSAFALGYAIAQAPSLCVDDCHAVFVRIGAWKFDRTGLWE